MRYFLEPVAWVSALAVAAFLVLFWALRGAPIGQDVAGEGDEAPRGGYRDRVIAAMVLGLMLVCAGAYVASAYGVLWSIPVFALGFGIVFTLIAVNRRYRHGSPALRRTIDMSNALLNAALIAGVLIVINAMAFRYGGRAVDLTRERMFSLSSLTVKQVQNLAKPLKFTVFYGQSPVARAEMARVTELLELYKALDPSKVKIEQIDPYRDREQFVMLAERIPDVQVSEMGGIVLEYGQGESAQHLVVPNHDLFEFPRQGRFTEQNVEKFISSFKGEDAVTSALMRLRAEKHAKIVFVVGHGQPSLNDVDPRKEGLGLFRSRLTAMGAEVSEVNLIHDVIPREAEIVIAIGGKTPFQDSEVVKLRQYLAGGRPLLAIIGNPGPSGLEDLLKAYNITLEKGLIVDPKHNFRNPSLVAVGVGGATHHPVIDPLANNTLLFVNAAPLKVLAPGAGKPNGEFIAIPILMTSRDSWAETDLTNRRASFDPDKDQKGPLNVGVAVVARGNPDQGQPEQTPRLVVFSSLAMVDNVFLGVDPANLDLVVNATNWLRNDPTGVGIMPKKHEDIQFSADSVLRVRLVFIPTVMAVLMIVLLGLLTYANRRV
ncbi:MAG: GldG family protein [Isosphaeraceae bacterium]|nr:GldG family protein [Isosphaeraceae bacterium]